MSTHSFFFSSLIAPGGACPSPWACGAYPRAGHGCMGGSAYGDVGLIDDGG